MSNNEEFWKINKKPYVIAGVIIGLLTYGNKNLFGKIMFSFYLIIIAFGFLGFIYFIGLLAGNEMKDIENNFGFFYKILLIMASIFISSQVLNPLFLVFLIILLILASRYESTKGQYTYQQIGDASVLFGTTMLKGGLDNNEE